MSHNGQLIRKGVYRDSSGHEYTVFGHVIHSETSEQYILLFSHTASTPRAVPFKNFINPAAKLYHLATPVDFTDISSFVGKELLESGTYEHYKSHGFDRKLYNVFGTVEAPNGADWVIYHPLYGQQPLMARPYAPVNPEDADEGAFDQKVSVGDYSGPRFWRVGELTE